MIPHGRHTVTPESHEDALQSTALAHVAGPQGGRVVPFARPEHATRKDG